METNGYVLRPHAAPYRNSSAPPSPRPATGIKREGQHNWREMCVPGTLALPDVAKDTQMKNPQSEDIISTLTTSTSSDQLVQTVKITMKAKISAPIEAVFEALLEEIGPRYQGPNGVSLRLKLEPWPGGRWLRDYGNNTGYFWAQVQSIMPPTLLELYGPMFMSSPVTSQVQFRLTTENSATEISLVYGTLGEIPLAFRDGTHLNERWKVILASVRDNAERRR